jgi:hypothetical protein
MGLVGAVLAPGGSGAPARTARTGVGSARGPGQTRARPGRSLPRGPGTPGRRDAMLKGGLLWLIGIPIPIIILLFLFGVL